MLPMLAPFATGLPFALDPAALLQSIPTETLLVLGLYGALAGAYLVAVLPSLIVVALFLPWSFGWEWPGPALLYLGALIALSPMIDRKLGYAPSDFLRLRLHLSLGLGGLTIALGLLAGRVMTV